ncbi:stage VI sporulation protein F [Aneurinibacillus sp. UBA3580]|uniref:stage VI sporulation protein F n=1 Tax=Aneurinibacillus sp. UBA3580 TaxID=1946041 RepID=UPI0025803B07|nr:stage VI sporulation protein F [Aneurinibacillus sp. UBA3580]
MVNIPKKFLDKLQGRNVDTSKLEKLAGGVKKSDLGDDQKLLQLIRQLAVIANVSLTKEKEEKIIKYIRTHNVQGGDMKTLTNLLKNKL